MSIAPSSGPRPPRDGRLRRRLLLGAAAAAVAILALGVGGRQMIGPTVPASIRPSTTPAPAGLGDVGSARLPDIDPVPWTAVDWRVVPRAIAAKPVAGLDRIDGLTVGGPGLIGWGRISQPGRNQFNDLGAIHLSANGVGWTVVPLAAGVGPEDTSELQLVSDGPEGILVIGGVCCTGEEAPAMWQSPDGLAWHRLPFPAELVDARLTRLIALSEFYVVAGQLNGRARIWSSADGLTWDSAGTEADGLGRGSVEDLAVAPSSLVAVGKVEDAAGHYDGALWTSPDGFNWVRQDVDVLEGDADTIVGRVVPWTNGLMLVGVEGDHAERVQCDRAGGVGGAQPPRPGSRDFSCAWGTEMRWVTRDGTGWNRVVQPGGIGAPPAQPGDLIEFRLVAAGGPGLVNLGEGLNDEGATTWVSADGLSWQPTAPQPQWRSGVLPTGIVVGGRTIVAVGDGPTVQIGTVR